MNDPLAENLFPSGDFQVPIPLNRIRGIEQEDAFLVITLGAPTDIPVSEIPAEGPKAGLAIESPSGQQVYALEEPYLTLVATARAGWNEHMVADTSSRIVLREMAVTTPQPFNLQELKSMETAVAAFIAQEKEAVATLKFNCAKERLVLQLVPKVVVGGTNVDLFTIFARVKIVKIDEGEGKKS